MLKSQLYLS